MMYKFNKNIECKDSSQCSEKMKSNIETLTGPLFHSILKKSSGHLSVSHVQGNHQIWIFLYDKGKHESETNDIVVMKDSDDVTKYEYNDTLPTLEQIKEVC
jgi:hypothetical protein